KGQGRVDDRTVDRLTDGSDLDVMVTGRNRHPTGERTELEPLKRQLTVDVDVHRRGVRRGMNHIDAGITIGTDAEGSRATGRRAVGDTADDRRRDDQRGESTVGSRTDREDLIDGARIEGD